MKLSSKQRLSIRESTRRINCWEGSVRSGKTIASLIRWIQFCGNYKDSAPLVMVGKTERTLKNNILTPMKWLIGDAFQYSVGRHDATIFNRPCLVFGANDERSEGKIRGLTSGGAYCDEITLWPSNFWSMLLSRCSPEGAKLFVTTNADSPYHWFKTGYLDRIDKLDMVSFHFDISDNPFLSKAYVDALKNEYTGLWYKRFILGLWVLAEGAVYDFFEDREPYVITAHPKATSYFVGVDYGMQNACTFGLMGVNRSTKPKIWTEREYYHSGRETGKQKTDSEYADDLKTFLGGTIPQAVICDPSAKSFVNELTKRGYSIREANNSVIDGIRLQAAMLKAGDYAICKPCVHTIKEYFVYTWDQKAQLRGVDLPNKRDDHTKDRERYVLMTLFGEAEMDYAGFTAM